jgi:polyphosphate kinase 2 (PPK2 family)
MYAEDKRSLLVVLQALDAGGKDGTIRKVFGPINPQGCRVTSFKVPTKLESSHDFLWRIHQAAPASGKIAVFNRSHYESVLIEAVHGWINPKEEERRLAHIRSFEALLADRGTVILKFFSVNQ